MKPTTESQSESSQSETPQKHETDSIHSIPPFETPGEPISEKPTLHPDDTNNPDINDPAPDGGREAWFVALGSFSIFFCCLGFSNSFGPLADYYLTHQLVGHSIDEIAWIGSLAVFLQFFVAVIGGPLFDHYGAKVLSSRLHVSCQTTSALTPD